MRASCYSKSGFKLDKYQRAVFLYYDEMEQLMMRIHSILYHAQIDHK